MQNQEKGSRSYLFSIVLVAVLGGLLFGYDTAVISGAEKGLQAFFMGAKDFTYTDFWHGFTSSSALIGCIIGSAFSGLLATNFGRKKSLILAGVLFFISAWGSMNPETMVLAKGVPNMTLLIVFNIYRVIGGIGVGLASAVCPMYIGEIAPSNIRGMLVSWNQFAIIFGQLVVYFVNFFILGSHIAPIIESIGQGMNQITNGADAQWAIEHGWRYMFGSEMVPAGLFALLISLVPETPRYLASIGKDAQAETILAKINGATKAKEILGEIKATMTEKTEKLLAYGVLCIFVGIMLSVFQQAVGINAVLYYAPRLFQEMGSGTDISMTQTVIMGVVNIIFTISAATLIDRVGRKRLLVKGAAGMAVCMAVLSILAYFGVVGLTTTIFIVAYSAFFMLSWGPAYWVLISEIFPNSIRSKAVALCITVQWIVNYAVSATFPSLSDWNLGTTFLIYGFISAISGLFAMKCLPETKGMTLEEIGSIWKSDAK